MGMGATHGGRGRRPLMADINVTPLVDVMLVLLIIFMVTAPMMTQGLDVDLPETTAKALPQKEEPIVITIGADGVDLGPGPRVISLEPAVAAVVHTTVSPCQEREATADPWVVSPRNVRLVA